MVIPHSKSVRGSTPSTKVPCLLVQPDYFPNFLFVHFFLFECSTWRRQEKLKPVVFGVIKLFWRKS